MRGRLWAATCQRTWLLERKSIGTFLPRGILIWILFAVSNSEFAFEKIERKREMVKMCWRPVEH